ncbi:MULTISPECIES: chemotaxis protein CheW [unclassified Pseudomonas]|uniref:chemotaxis protein CheW n=1 Tax=unclassified Pseudomonas TaxID=196821 RepID=UPI001647434A|nr:MULTISPECIES: chemotaxis protein CheW [unclassified Pseudomonas]MBC3422487.1 chemotaxis protein CheW [Pseudomonas sp. RW3S2]MBC3466359.1 chemotaxis protein CheW [Pseudomonas sp. RW10S2]QXI43775.1 chemotaxis protein CheW [Pseudomonas wayambapalatensis]
MLEHIAGQRSSLTGLLLPLGDRTLVLPNVAVAELIGERAFVCERHQPAWHMGWIDWRQQRLPLIGFEAACGGETPCGERARIVVLNALGDTGLRYLAVLLQGIPRSCKLDSQLNYVDVPLGAMELAAVQVGDQVARVPDLAALERLVRDADLQPLVQ